MTEETLGYIGECPPITEFETSKMNEKQLDELKKYIDSFNKNNIPYDLMKECVSYCISDVVILRLSFQSFRKVYIDGYELDPLRSSTTIASLCFKIFQSSFLKKSQIPIIDRYRGKCYSFKGIYLACYIAFKLKCEVRHARSNEGELAIKIEGKLFYCDASFNCPTTGKLVLVSFHGCYYHACKQCIESGKIKPTFRDGISAKEIYEKTIWDDEVKSRHYKHIVMWECTYNAFLNGEQVQYKSNYEGIDSKPDFMSDFKGYVNKYAAIIRYKSLSLDSALSGGRTNAVRLFVDLRNDPTKHLVYKDICSLYPFIQLSGHDFPVGPPRKKIAHEVPSVNDFVQTIKNDTFFGLARVDVLPPKNLKLPVLFIKVGKKLVFPLCRKCAEIADHDKDCTHNNKDRLLANTYSSVELKLALSKNYIIVEVYETWEFDRDATVFSEYQNVLPY